MSDDDGRIPRRALFGRLLPQAERGGHWVKVHRTAMACRFEVTLDSKDARHVEAARAALDEVAAIGTTATGEQQFEVDGRRFGHVLDPRSGRPAEGVRSASVVASEAAVADALSTAFLVAGPREILVLGRREGVAIEPAAGVRVVEATA